jgi:hypothetical protein
MNKRTKPTRQQIREVRKIQRERERLRVAENHALQKLAEQYIPCQVGDIIEGGIKHIEKGKVTSRRCDVYQDGSFCLRVYYLPLRGKRYLKNTNIFHDMTTIKVIKPASKI